MLWSINTTAEVISIAVNSNKICCGFGDGTVKCFDLEGIEIGTISLPNSPVYCIDLDNEGNVYTGSRDLYIRKISIENKVVWSYNTGSEVLKLKFSPGFLYYGSYSRSVNKISLQGDLKWSYTGFSKTNTINDLIVDNEGNVYSASGNGTGDDCNVKKISPYGSLFWQVSQYKPFTNESTYASALAIDTDSTLYVIDSYAGIKKLAKDGKEIWVHKLPASSSLYSVSAYNDYLYCGKSGGIAKLKDEYTKQLVAILKEGVVN